VPEAVRVPENVLLPVKVWVLARIANSLVVLGKVKVRVVPVAMLDSSNTAFLVGSASSVRVKAVSATPAANRAPINDTHDPALNTSEVSAASFQANQPSFGA